jgi:PAS domain S-box-containing protein
LSSKAPSRANYLRLATEYSPVLIWVRNPDGSIAYANEAWRNYTGESVERLDAADFFSLFHPGDIGKRLHEWLTNEEQRHPFQMELRLRRADHAYRWHLVRLQPIFQKNGVLTSWAGVCVDVDDQHRSTEALQFLSNAGDALATSLNLKTTLRRVAELAVNHIADWCAFYILRENQLESTAFAHHDPRQREGGAELLENCSQADTRIMHAIQIGETIFLPTLPSGTTEEIVQDEEHIRFLRELGMTSAILVPLRSRGKPLGLLQLAMQNGRRTYTQADASVAQDLARRAALAIENAQLYEREQQTTQQLRFLADASLVLAESLDLDKRLERLISIIVPQIATWASVNLLSEDGSVQTVAIAHRDKALAPVIAALRGSYYGKLNGNENGATRDVLRDGRTRLVPEIDDAFLRKTILSEKLLVIRALGASSGIFVPLTVRDRVLGSISVIRAQRERPFTQADIPLLEELARRAAVAIENAQLFTREQMVAETFQTASLPAPLPSSPGLIFSGYYEPGRTEALIGGDWYDALRLPDGRILISIGDVSGNGLQAAIIMGSVRQVIRGVAHISTDPIAILEAADKALQSQYPDRIVTAFVGIIDPQAKALVYASAGHPPPFLRSSDGSIAELSERGLPLGLRSREEPATEITMTDGDLLILYTDGLIESTRDILDGQTRLRTVLSETAPTGDRDLARTIAARVLRAASSSDDVAVLTVHIRSPMADDLETRRRARERFSEGSERNKPL